MNFTREPIIETIVSPKDGYKLCIRNSKLSGAEEFFVDSVEVVSFGNSLFFRGQERPKPFLVPVSDYEVFEVKETRVVLKNIAHDRNIKIGGGREASLKPNRDNVVEKKEETEEVREGEVAAPVGEGSSEPRNDRKRDRRRSRRRRLAEKRNAQERTSEEQTTSSDEPVEEGDDETEEAKALPPPAFTHLLPPPPVLISERLNQLRSKEMAEGAISGVAVEGEIKEVVMEEVEPSQMHNVSLDEEDEDFTF